MTVRELLASGERTLRQANIENANRESRFLAAKAFEFADLSQLRLQYNAIADKEAQEKYINLLRCRTNGEPLQYILGEWEFYGLPFQVAPGVLIPRPETEWLVQFVLEKCRESMPFVCYDLCAGSGCVGLSIAKLLPQANVFLFEKYPVPLQYINKNRTALAISKTNIIAQDVCAAPPENLPRPHVIVCNPPYITSRDMSNLQQEVRQEPPEALHGGVDGLDFYRSLAAIWLPILLPGGTLAVECGEKQSSAVVSILVEETQTDSVQTANDCFGVERFVIWQKKAEP
jgi:release factor glutamine methyltransferase